MRTVYHVTKTDTGWKGQEQNASTPVVTGATKEEVMKETIARAKQDEESQVIIHRTDGQIEEERTYPRSSDPATIG